MINHQTSSNKHSVSFTPFVTISTPWGGHAAAASGVDNAPVAVPSWFDMVPGSPFLRSLHGQPLPDSTNYYLLFGHKGDGTRVFNHSNTDGTVTLRSQLP